MPAAPKKPATAHAKVEPAPPAADEDLSRYTVDASGTAPVQNIGGSSDAPKPSKKASKKSKKKDDDSTQINTEGKEEIQLETKNKRMFTIGIAISILVFVATFGILYLRFQQTTESTAQIVVEDQPEAVETDTSEAETTESTDEIEQLERGDITLQILNGSGVSGLAGTTSDTFENLGYSDIDTGNADDVEGNELYVDAEVKDLVEVLLGDVGDELNIEKITGDLEDSDFSARIILGS